jgi:hypothetical protein
MKVMRRIAIFREGNQMCSMIGPDWVGGLGGFGETVPEALRDLAAGFNEYGYQLRDNAVVVEVAGRSIQAGPAQTAAAAIQELADMLEQAGFPEDAYAEPDWKQIAREEKLVTEGYGKLRPFIVNSQN